MRIDAWVGLVTDASPFAAAVPAGAATTLINLRPKLGVLESRPGMRRIGFAGYDGQADLLDCCAVTLEGAPAILALDASGNLLALRSPNYGPPTTVLPPLQPCAGPEELLIDYTQRLAGGSEADELEPCLPDPPPPPGDDQLGFVLDGGTSDTSPYPYVVDALEPCPTLPEVDGGNAAYDGRTSVTVGLFCTSSNPPPEPPPPPPPGSPPSVPLALAVQFGAASAALSWQPPASNGGQPVTGYEVQISLDGSLWITQPGVPTALTVSFGNQSAALSWTAPADNGNAALSGYDVTVEASTNNGSTWTPVSP